MIIVMERTATEENIQKVTKVLEEHGFRVMINRGEIHTVIDAFGDKTTLTPGRLAAFEGVKEIKVIREPFRLASRDRQPEDTVIEFENGVKIGVTTDFYKLHLPQKKWAVNFCAAAPSNRVPLLMISKGMKSRH